MRLPPRCHGTISISPADYRPSRYSSVGGSCPRSDYCHGSRWSAEVAADLCGASRQLFFIARGATLMTATSPPTPPPPIRFGRTRKVCIENSGGGDRQVGGRWRRRGPQAMTRKVNSVQSTKRYRVFFSAFTFVKIQRQWNDGCFGPSPFSANRVRSLDGDLQTTVIVFDVMMVWPSSMTA